MRADAGGAQVMKAAMQRLRQIAERGGGEEGGRRAKGAGLPFWPWCAWAARGSSGAGHRKGGPPRHQALLPGNWKARGLSAHSALPVITGCGGRVKGVASFFRAYFSHMDALLKRTDVSS